MQTQKPSSPATTRAMPGPTPSSPKPDPSGLQHQWWTSAKGKQVRLHLLTTRTLEGKLGSTDQFTLALQTGAASTILVFKQAVAWAEIVQLGGVP